MRNNYILGIVFGSGDNWKWYRNVIILQKVLLSLKYLNFKPYNKDIFFLNSLQTVNMTFGPYSRETSSLGLVEVYVHILCKLPNPRVSQSSSPEFWSNWGQHGLCWRRELTQNQENAIENKF